MLLTVRETKTLKFHERVLKLTVCYIDSPLCAVKDASIHVIQV